MGNTNNSIRIRTDVGVDKYITFNLDSEYDTLEILSLKINQRGSYRYHTSTYGVVVGRVLANNGFGVPNAKLSLFIAKDENSDVIENAIYPYTTVGSKNDDGIRYNLLPSNQKDDCHQVVGTFPSKRMILDDNSVLEVFDKYYIYTTRTNESGDYMFFGIPTGSYNLHMDLDISDCGKLSQRPRDFIYKGYSLDQFQSANQFKIDTELSSLSQIFTQDTSIEVKPFWGDADEGTNIGITREDINVNYTFEPTCVFMGSIISDNPNEGISKRCVPTNRMGDMRELVTGSGTIEILRKKIDNTIEELEIKGTQLIDGNGVWCFQIPMNLDYVMTDEYGNMVPTDNPEKGIPTRCEVRFRISMDETQSEGIPYKRGKVLVPNNPEYSSDVDYEFGSKTKDESFKSLMWNNVYSVKSFIPRFQKSRNIKTDKFTGIKNVNINKGNNPMPYNNIRIKIPFMFWLTCNIVKLFIRITQIINKLKVVLMRASLNLANLHYAYISNEICPDLEYWYFAPGMHLDAPSYTLVRKFWDWIRGKNRNNGALCDKWQHESVCKTFHEIATEIKEDEGNISDTIPLYFFLYKPSESDAGDTILTEEEWVKVTDKESGNARYIVSEQDKENVKLWLEGNQNSETQSYVVRSNWIKSDSTIMNGGAVDGMSAEVINRLEGLNPRIHLTPDVNYLMQCVEMNLAQEYEVIKFDFYNDWINGTIYLPRWARDVKYKRRRKFGKRVIVEKVKGCINDVKRSRVSRRYMQQCSLQYDQNLNVGTTMKYGCTNGSNSLRCHKKQGSDYVSIFGRNSGAVQEQLTMLGDYVYYMKPKEGDVLLFATDIIMLGTLFDCNEYGIPSTFESLMSTTYKMPTNMALTNVENDSYSYMDEYDYTVSDVNAPDYNYEKNSLPPTIEEAAKFDCGSVCALDMIATSGATAKVPSYSEINEMLDEYELAGSKNTGEPMAIEYEDIFPITEMSGIEWGYTGPGQGEPSDDKMYAPGGHFMGLACGNAETNIRSCVNLKRACEIGTTLSEHFDIPIGYKSFDDENEESEYDVVNYLYVSPNGLISKDQVVDVTFRSAFATMNQNSLATITDPITKHKKYKFEQLIPDSFDGCLNNIITDSELNNKYNQRIVQDWDEFWDSDEFKADDNFLRFIKNDILLEHGYTINRLLETKSNDYIKFRHGEDPKFLKGDKKTKTLAMPVYRNSFYFYFGLKDGMTALDEFKSQFFAPCAKSILVGNESNISYKEIITGGKFIYDIEVTIKNMSPTFSYILTRSQESNEVEVETREYKGENIMSNTFTITDIPIGRYYLKVLDKIGNEVATEVIVGVNNYNLGINLNSIQNYKEKVEEGDVFEKGGYNGGTIDGTFEVTLNVLELSAYTYNVEIVKDNGISLFVGEGDWVKYYDSEQNRLWLFGPGEYKVYIHVTIGDDSDKYFYCDFDVDDGVLPASIYLTDSTGTYIIGYDELKEIGDDKWGGPEEFGNSEFKWYKSLVNTNKFGESFNLNLSYSGDSANMFSPELGGKGEKVNGNEYDVTADVTLNTKVPKGYTLSLMPYVGSNMKDRGNFYYTAYNSWNQTYASDYIIGEVIDAQTIEIKSNGQLPKNGYLCISSHSNEKIIASCEINDNIINIKDRDLNIKSGTEVRVADMVSLPVYVYPFAFKTIMGMFYGSNWEKKVDNIKNLVSNSLTLTQCFMNTLDTNDYEIPNADEKLLVIREHSGDESYPKEYLAKQEFQIPMFVGELKYSHKEGDTDIGFRIFGINENLDGTEKYYLTTSTTQNAIDLDRFIENGTSLSYENTLNALTGSTLMNVKEGDGEKFVEANVSLELKDVWAYGLISKSVGDGNEECQFNDKKEVNFIHTFGSNNNKGKFNFNKCIVFPNDTIVEHNYSDGKIVNGNIDYKLYKWENSSISELPTTDEKYIFTKISLTNNGSVTPEFEITVENDDYRYDSIYKKIGDIQQKGTWPIKFEYSGFSTYYAKDSEGNAIEQPKLIFKYGNTLNWETTVIEPTEEMSKEELDRISGTFHPVMVAHTGSTGDGFDVGTIIKHVSFVDNTEMVLTWDEISKDINFRILYVYDYDTQGDDGSGSISGGDIAINTGTTETMDVTITITPRGSVEGTCDNLDIYAEYESEISINVAIYYNNIQILSVLVGNGSMNVELDSPIPNFDGSKVKVMNNDYNITTNVNELVLDEVKDSENEGNTEEGDTITE